jgi:hypothetical protein
MEPKYQLNLTDKGLEVLRVVVDAIKQGQVEMAILTEEPSLWEALEVVYNDLMDGNLIELNR